MVDTQDERELKFDVPDGFRLPSAAALAKAAGAGASARASTVQLTSTYYDTDDRALLRHRVTLRRREGDRDTGWHLKVPHEDVRTELRLPLAAGADVPEQLAALVTGLTLGAPLQPIATVRTTRQLTGIYGGDSLLAEVADDTVHGATFGDTAQLSEWREVEVELGDGDEKLLSRIGKKLLAAGARDSTSSSKLARTVGAEAPVHPARDEATQLLAEYLEEQFEAVSAGDVALRRGLEPVHKTRVAIRRLRSILRVYASLLPDDLDSFEADLSWYQNVLGVVRDRQVQRPRLAAVIAELPPELVLGPVAADIEQTLLGEQARAREELLGALSSERYLAMLERIRAIADDPPTPQETQIADLVAGADAAYKKAVKRLRTGAKAKDVDLLHRARKAAKRARYAAELVTPAAGKRAEKRVERLKDLQDVLGEHQDSVQSAAILLRVGASTGAKARRNGFTFGVLYQREQQRQAELIEQAVRLRL
ncbi:MAG TPA: CYTH and CHAD domain-containing protein [Jatrophihabitans sp.]|nr:CYTH and CHAD domain-containing protein [Jatrophihabitans sp.]